MISLYLWHEMKLFFIGFMGCGKTHWGKMVSEKLQLPFFDLDKKIEEQAGKTINDIFEQEGEEYFRQMEKEIMHLLVEGHDSFVMATGGGTACYYNNIDYMKKNGTVIWINCSIDCLYQRLSADQLERPLIRELSGDQLKSYITKKFGDRKIYYQQASLIVNEDDIKIDQLVHRIFHP
jgi:shikimate kinase